MTGIIRQRAPEMSKFMLYRLCTGIVFLMLWSPVYSIETVNLENDSRIKINGNVEYFFTTDKSLDIDQVLMQYGRDFRANPADNDHFGVHPEGIHWFHFRARNITAEFNWIFYVDFSDVERVDFFYSDSRGGWIHQEAGDNVDLQKAMIRSRVPAFRLSDSSGEVDYYFRVYNRFPQVYPFVISQLDIFEKKEFRVKWFFIVLMGVSIATLLYCIAVAIISRKRIFLYYTAYIVSLNIIELVVSGLWYLWVYRGESELGQRAASLAMSVYCAAGMKYFQHLYGIDRNRRLLQAVVNGFVIAQIPVIAHTLSNELFYTYIIAWVDTAIYGFFVLGGSFYMLRTENRKIARLAIIAWIPLMASVFWLYFGFANLVPFMPDEEFLFYGAVAMEQVIFLMLAVFWWKNLEQSFPNIARQHRIMKIRSTNRHTAPGFLKDSLQDLKTQIEKNNPRVEKTIQELAAVYNYMTYHIENDLVDFRDEWNFARRYFLVMNRKLGNLAFLQKKFSGKKQDVEKFSVPPLMLQLILERILNIVQEFHFSAARRSPRQKCEITVFAKKESGGLLVRILLKKGPKLQEDSLELILKEINDRLQLFYPGSKTSLRQKPYPVIELQINDLKKS